MAETIFKEFDVVIFGATGYTGEYVVEEVAKVLKESEKKWAVAGRNANRLKASLRKVQQYLEEDNDITEIPIIVADVENESSIDAMCKKTKLVLNCVGPYKLYGEVVVASCVKNKTHYIDLSVEIKFNETMQAKYFYNAKENHTYIVSPCGYSAIPADYGLALMKEKFPGDLNSVEIFSRITTSPEGLRLHTGTMESLLDSIPDFVFQWQFRDIVKHIFTRIPPFSSFHIPYRMPVSYYHEVDDWCVSAYKLMPDSGVLMRSQMFGFQFLNERPVQSREYAQNPRNTSLLSNLFVIFILFVLSFLSLGKYLVKKYPSQIFCGVFSKEGPTRKQVEMGSTKFTLIGKGWRNKLPLPSDQHPEAPNLDMKLVIRGPEPAYLLTSICMVHCGLTILDETDKFPLNGGVLTPGIAFAKTTLWKRLQNRGISFEFSKNVE